AARRAPEIARGCPSFGNDSVRTRNTNARETPEDSVAPGLHRSAGGGELVWWDPRALELGVPALGGIPEQGVLVATEAGDEWLQAYEAWRAERDATLANAAKPTQVARTITALAKDKAEADSELDSTGRREDGKSESKYPDFQSSRLHVKSDSGSGSSIPIE